MTTPQKVSSSPQVVAPSLFATSQRAARANAMIADAGRALQKLASENTELHTDRISLQEKVSSEERRNALFRVAVDSAARGAIKVSQVNALVDQWHKEGRDPQFYADLYSARMDLSFAAAGESPSKSSSQVVDKQSSARQDGPTGPDMRHYDSSAIDKFLAENR